MANVLVTVSQVSWQARSQQFVHSTLQFCGIDRAIAYTLIGRGWSVFAGPVTLFLIARFLRPDQQGFYYTFGSVLGLNVFFELGLTYVLLQFASHEKAQLEWTSAGTIMGSPLAKERLAALLKFAVRWYALAALLCLVTVLPAGLIFFSRSFPADANVVWRAPWIWLTIVSALSMCVSPLFSVLEGCGKVCQIAAMRVQQSVIASLGLWFGLLCHGGLFASPIFQTLNLVFALSWVGLRYGPFFRDLLSVQLEHHPINWSKEVWPFQWRIALSWLSGYFIFQLFNPMLFSARGPAEAGRMGMSLALCGAMSAVAMAWMSTKVAPFGMLVAKGDYQELDRLFFRTLSQSLIVLVTGCTITLVAVFSLDRMAHPFASRLLTPVPFAMLLGSTLINHVVFCQAYYLRTHKQEPFLVLSVFGAILTGSLTYLLAKPFGATGVASGYLATSFTGLALASIIFRKKRLEWHAV